MNTEYKAFQVVSPGKVLLRELEARNWTQRDLAEIMGRPYQAINEIINGAKLITPDTAREIARALGTSIDFWINLETNYRLHLAEKEDKEKEIIRRSRLYSIAPVREMIKRSWISGSQGIEELEKQVCEFLEILSPESPVITVANFRQSPDRDQDIIAQTAWVKRIEHLAQEQAVSIYHEDKLKDSIYELLKYSTNEISINQISKKLSSSGVHFLIVPHLPKTYLDGVAITTYRNPIIALTLRYDRIDSFWFTLMHELAHLVLGHKGIILDNTEEGHGTASTQEENDANDLTQEWLIPKRDFSYFVKAVKPHFSRAAIEEFANKIQRHPGIVLGKMHHDNIVEYKHLRALLIKVGPFLKKDIHS